MKRRVLQFGLTLLGFTISSCSPEPDMYGTPYPEYGATMTMFHPSERVVDTLDEDDNTEDEDIEPTTDNTSL